MTRISDYLPDRSEREFVKWFCDLFEAQWMKVFDGDKLLVVVKL